MLVNPYILLFGWRTARCLYAITTGGPVIEYTSRSGHWISYSGSCFGMRSLPLATVGESWFPKSGRSYKGCD